MNKATEIAHYFITLAQKEDENDLTNLKLQKILYFAQGDYLIKTGNCLFSDNIEAWKYGPVIREVYEEFNHCGSFPITVFDIPSKVKLKKVEAITDFLDDAWNKYGKFSASHLVSQTHTNGSSWYTTYNKMGAFSVIDPQLMKENWNKHQICDC